MKTKRTAMSVLLLLMVILLVSCAGAAGGVDMSNTEQEETLKGESNVLVAYFSWSSDGNTRMMAHYIAEETSGEIFRIIPEVAYTTNYTEVLDVAQNERDTKARPNIKDNVTQEQLNNYDYIFIGYPIWWYDAPMIIYSFVESLDFRGKTIIPFATSGGSNFCGSDAAIAEICEGATICEGLQIRGSNVSNLGPTVRAWIQRLEIE